MSEDSTVTTFKKKKSRPAGLMRKRKQSDEEDGRDEPESRSTEWQALDELKELQKVRSLSRQNRGVNVCDLLIDPSARKAAVVKKEKVEKVGLTDAASLASELDLTNTFSKETNRRDEDAEMGRFIEEELAKRKGLQTFHETNKQEVTGQSLEETVFSVLPLLQATASTASGKSEEMLSNQMLSGIPEVDLGVEERIRNVEATEEAKMKMLHRQRRQHSDYGNDSLIPTNVAVNFSHNNRQKVRDLKQKQQTVTQVPQHVEPVVVIGDEPRTQTFRDYPQHQRVLKHPGNSRASDDYHFERFRKQIRR